MMLERETRNFVSFFFISPIRMLFTRNITFFLFIDLVMNEFVGMQLAPEILDLLCTMYEIHHFFSEKEFSHWFIVLIG